MTQNNPSISQKQPDAEKQDSVYRIATIIFGAALVVVSFYLFLAFRMGNWQIYALSAVIAGFAAMNWLAMSTIRKGEIDRGSWMIVIGIMVVFPLAVLLIASISLIFGLVLFVLAAAVSTQTLDKKQARRANIYAFSVGFITTLLDFLPLDYRLFVPEIQVFVPAITTVIVLAIVFLAIRNSKETIKEFWNTSIHNRLRVIILGIAILPVLSVSLILGFSTYTQVKNALVKDTFDKLSAIESIKHTQLQTYLAKREDEMKNLGETAAALRQDAIAKLEAVNKLKRDEVVRTFAVWDNDARDIASDPGVVTGAIELSLGFRNLSSSQVRALYQGKPELKNAGDESLYSIAHAEQHNFFSGYTDIHNYEDAYLIDLDGNLIYSLQKNNAFGTNLISGPYQDSNLASLYQNLLETDAGQSSVTDIGSFDGANTLFIGAPIYQDTTLVGILAFQIPLEEINALVQNRVGLTTSAETYLVGKVGEEALLRSNRVVKEGAIGDPKPGIDTERALAGESDHEFKVGSTGDYEISVFDPLPIPGLNWAVITTGNVIEIFSPQVAGREKDFFSAYADSQGYDDIFLIDPQGYIFYSAKKEADYQTNILTGEYSNTNLALLVSEMKQEKQYGFVDFSFYAPSGNQAAAFFGIPLLNESNQNQIDLFVAAQSPVSDINLIMNEASGLGESGESYIIGQDFLGRMDSRFIEDFGVETTVLNEDYAVNTEAVRSALAGESGQGVIIDYRGLPVLSVWDSIVVHQADNDQYPERQIWAVMTEIDQSEALLPVNQLASGLALIIGLATLAIGAAAVFFGTRFAIGFVTPIIDLTDTATQVAAGNLDLRLATDSKDEIGTLTNTFNSMTAQLQETLGGLEERVAARTKDLATVANISTITATIRDPENMLTNMVHLTQRGFGLYHAHVFTFDEEQDLLSIVACGYRQGDEHEGTHGTTTIPMGQEQSLVARAARTRQPVIINDVRNEPGWLPNPLLPETRSEMAVPMIVGDELLGVLDVQSERLDAFSEEDANIQMTLASQIATALQNALTYEETQKRAELESLANVIGQRIQRTTSIEDTLQTAIRELGTAIGAKRVNARLQPDAVEKED